MIPCDAINYGLYRLGGKMRSVLRTSEFWLGIIAGFGWLLAQVGVVPQEDFNQFLVPALTYISGRVLSKGAKKAVPSA